MQFLAFLKDSYREARSGWMLQIMLILAALLVLLVASIGFRPVNPEDQLAAPLKAMTWALASNPPRYDEIGRPTFEIENFTATNKAEPWKSDYAFDFLVKTPSPADMRKYQRSGMPADRNGVRHLIRDGLGQYFERVRVEEPPAAAAFLAAGGGLAAAEQPWLGSEVRYNVKVSGSQVDDPLAWPHRITVLFAFEVPYWFLPLRSGVYYLQKWLLLYVAAVIAVLVSVISTSGFVPTMLAKGSLDLLASKPIGRTTLLVYKYVGGLAFILILTAATGLGVWVAVGLRTGLWGTNFLAVIPVLTFYFAILYAVSVGTAVFTRNTLAAILVTLVVWGGLTVIGFTYDAVRDRDEAAALPPIGAAPAPPSEELEVPNPDKVFRRIDPDAPLWGFIPKSAFPAIRALHAISPRTYQLDTRMGRMIAEGVLSPNQLKAKGYDKPPRESWAEMIGVSLGFMAVVLGLAAWRLKTRDF